MFRTAFTWLGLGLGLGLGSNPNPNLDPVPHGVHLADTHGGAVVAAAAAVDQAVGALESELQQRRHVELERGVQARVDHLVKVRGRGRAKAAG